MNDEWNEHARGEMLVEMLVLLVLFLCHFVASFAPLLVNELLSPKKYISKKRRREGKGEDSRISPAVLEWGLVVQAEAFQ